MAFKYEDYLPGGEKGPKTEDGVIAEEINDAAQQQQARQEDATPEIDWETRYKELEKLNSRQAQIVGEQRKQIDEYILSTTPTSDVDSAAGKESQPITVDDLYSNPEETIRKVVDSHPDVQQARQIKADSEQQAKEAAVTTFQSKHPDYAEISQTPEFQNWVLDDGFRRELYDRGNQFDMTAADALFSLYKSEKGLNQVREEQSQQQAIDAAELESGSATMVQGQVPEYSRSEYINKLTRARQGDLDADNWVKLHASKYRAALASGNVRD